MSGVDEFLEAAGSCKVSLTFRNIVIFKRGSHAMDCRSCNGVQNDGVIQRQEVMLDLWHNKQYGAQHVRDALPQNAGPRDEAVEYISPMGAVERQTSRNTVWKVGNTDISLLTHSEERWLACCKKKPCIHPAVAHKVPFFSQRSSFAQSQLLSQ